MHRTWFLRYWCFNLSNTNFIWYLFLDPKVGVQHPPYPIHPAYAYISNKPMKYLDQILYYLVDISLEEYFVFLILDEKSILRRGYASQIGGFSKGTHFLYRVYGFKLSYFKMKTPTDFTIIISVIASLVMSLSITGRYE